MILKEKFMLHLKKVVCKLFPLSKTRRQSSISFFVQVLVGFVLGRKWQKIIFFPSFFSSLILELFVTNYTSVWLFLSSWHKWQCFLGSREEWCLRFWVFTSFFDLDYRCLKDSAARLLLTISSWGKKTQQTATCGHVLCSFIWVQISSYVQGLF